MISSSSGISAKRSGCQHRESNNATPTAFFGHSENNPIREPVLSIERRRINVLTSSFGLRQETAD